MTIPTPTEAWAEMMAGNARFVAGTPRHPHQDVTRRHEIAAAQTPIATMFGCSDSRLAAEIIFDLGLGDLFVVRNAGQVPGESIIGSLEYAVEILKVPLLVVLGHDECGAVRAAIDSTGTEAPELPPHIWRQISPIVPAVHAAQRERVAAGGSRDHVDADRVGVLHLKATITAVLQSSELISTAVAEGRLGVVGASYRLAEGTVVPHLILGTANGAV